ncbi:hypothetical protein PsYK624_056900 [Phanerochaete sordida]|uniref:Uncharacterized protein n=1 Tax=Phanerochaete sordida TaxID=48140 RepID=A0A9P3G781_9APHY|nr:hypothetical protein PsYK624_056900 [Phanerochaete sordida]
MQAPPAPPPQETQNEHAKEHGNEHEAHTAPPTGTVSLAAFLSSLGTGSKAQETSTGSHSQVTSTLSATSSNIVSTSASAPTTIPHTSALTPASASSISYPVVSTHSPAPATGQSINRGSEEWKIIGVAVISFSAVAAILLLAVFFDQWWGFIRDMVWKKRRKEDHVEELIPDWEKAGWEIRMARNNDRYPSLPPLARTKSTTRDWDDLEKAPSDNMTGIGSGFATNNTYAPQPTHNSYAHGLGILTPAPQVRYADHQPPARSASLHRSNSRAAPSPAITLVDPYGGIE